MPDKKYYWESKKPCPDCGISICKYSTRCHPCSVIVRRKYSLARNLNQKTYDYIRHSSITNNLREDVFSKLGDKCALCGFDDKRALQVDHINNDGYAERAAHKGYKTRMRIILKDESKKYQILCANCNNIKKHEVLKHKLMVKYGQV